MAFVWLFFSFSAYKASCGIEHFSGVLKSVSEFLHVHALYMLTSIRSILLKTMTRI